VKLSYAPVDQDRHRVFKPSIFKVCILQAYFGGVMLKTAQKNPAHQGILMLALGLGLGLTGFKSGSLDRISPGKDAYLKRLPGAEIILQVVLRHGQAIGERNLVEISFWLTIIPPMDLSGKR
jgi:hypothetical protein